MAFKEAQMKWCVSLLLILVVPIPVIGDCSFPAIYNFGDSNSATGASATSPKSLIISSICDQLGLGYLYPYGSGGDFSHGANFAVGGASIRPPGYSDVNLGVQVAQFQNFKAQSSNPPDYFSKAIYTFDIGQNDLSYGFQHSSEDEVRASIPDILDKFSGAVQTLYKEGGRVFWVHNTGPIGCLPYTVIYYPNKDGNLDQSGCVRPRNDIAQVYNKQLKDRIGWLRTQLPGSVFTYVDVYSAKYALISDAKNQGFVDPMEFCCGSYYGAHVDCGQTATVNGTVYGGPCSNPSQHISWDGVHYSDAANLWVAKHILFGSLTDPAVSIKQACQK